MSCVHITGCQLASSSYAFPVHPLQVNKALTFKLPYLGRKLPKISLKSTSLTHKYQQLAPVCLFGGKGKSENRNEASPWLAIEKAMGSFQKNKSVENLLKEQIQKQEYYDGGDGGSGGKRPGGGGGGGDGLVEPEDESLSGMWEEFSQVIFATIGFIFLYIYIIEGEEINVLVKDFLKYVFTRQQSIRLRRLIDQWKKFFQSMKEEEYYDPNWLEREIINTPTMYDSPAKYAQIMKTILDSGSDDD